MMPPPLAAHNLTVQIGERLVCRNANLEFRQGECWGILGVNGAGKTTLLHTLAGLRAAENGESASMVHHFPTCHAVILPVNLA